MKRAILIALLLAAAATTIGVLQSRQLDDLNAYAEVLRQENHTIETTGDTVVAAGQPAGAPSTAAGDEPLIPVTGDPVVDATAILDFVADIDVDQGPDQQQGLALIEQISSTPAATIRALFDLAPSRDLSEQTSMGICAVALTRLAELGQADFAITKAAEMELPQHFAMSIAANWAAADPAAASAWLEEAQASGDYGEDFLTTASSAITEVLSKHTPVAAIERALEAPPRERGNILNDATRNITSDQDWLAFARHAVAIEDENLRTQALLSLSNGTLRNPHIADARHLVDQLAALGVEPKWLNPFITTATTREFDNHTGERADWLIERSSPERLHGNVEHLMGFWASNDYNAAGHWLQGLEPSPVRDTAVARFVDVIAPGEPQSAVDWALTITDEEKKRVALESVVARWQESDPEAAAAYLETVR